MGDAGVWVITIPNGTSEVHANHLKDERLV